MAADPISTILNILVEQGSPGIVGLIGGALLYKKFFVKEKANNANGNGKYIRDDKYVREEMCLERGRRIGDDIKRLQEESKIHFESQAKISDSLHKLDTKTDVMMEKLTAMGSVKK